MLKTLLSATALSALAIGVAPASAQSNNGPSPREQVGIHTGDTTTNGSAVIVTDRKGTHPEGYPGFAPVNGVAGSAGAPHHRRHAPRHHRAETLG
jgi:hypothetical protein